MEQSYSCKCTLCNQLCEWYQKEMCIKGTRSIEVYTSQGASLKLQQHTRICMYGYLAAINVLLNYLIQKVSTLDFFEQQDSDLC